MKKLIIIISIVLLPLFIINGISAQSTSKTNIIDSANLYSVQEENELLSQMKEIYEKYQIDVHILTMESMATNEELYINNYVKDLYNTEQPNYDVDAVVILITLKGYYNSNQRWIEISNYGYASEVISSYDVDNLTYKFTSRVGTSEYFDATSYLVDDVYNQIFKTQLMNNLMPHIIILVAALVISGLIGYSLVFNRGTKRTVSNYTYMNKETSKVLGRYDRYMRTTVVRTPRQQNSGGSSGSRGGGGGGRGSGGGRGF